MNTRQQLRKAELQREAEEKEFGRYAGNDVLFIRLHPELRNCLASMAAQRGMSINTFVRRVLFLTAKNHLNPQETP